ncbi:MAG: hypothetical protein ACYC37_03460 [Desulfobacteria bacterium]
MGDENTNVSNAEVFYGNPGGSPGERGNIDSALSGAFNSVEMAARSDGNYDLAREISGARTALGNEMMALGFSDASARSFAGLLGEYYSSPRDTKQAEANLDKALAELSHEWGADFDGRLEGAKGVLASLTKGNPRLLGFVHSTGLSHDVRFLRLAGEIAKHQPVAQAEKRGQAEAASRKRPSGNKMANVLYGGNG